MLLLSPELDGLEPDIFLGPFLEVIRSEDTSGPITGLALSTINKFLCYDLIGKKIYALLRRRSRAICRKVPAIRLPECVLKGKCTLYADVVKVISIGTRDIISSQLYVEVEISKYTSKLLRVKAKN